MNTLPDDNPLDTMPLDDLLQYARFYHRHGPWLEQIEAEIERRRAELPLAVQPADEEEFLRKTATT